MQTYKKYFSDKDYLMAVSSGLALFFTSLIINFYAGTYATERASNPVTDIVLSNTRVYDLDGIFAFGPLVLVFFVMLICMAKPQKIPFILKSVGFFILVRSLFISITHIGPFPDQLEVITGAELIKAFTFGGDLFFSAHTGLPFLMALIFNRTKVLKYMFTATAVVFGAVVLLSHRHYSIDVLSAFFITYTIYVLATKFFKREYVMFNLKSI